MRCAACRRPLSNPVSIQHGLGPDCLRRAVKAGTAPLESLEELKGWQRTNKQQRRAAAPKQDHRETKTEDMFAAPRREAIALLHLAVRECESLGVRVTLSIEE